ncbi:MAG: endolytic transglycosylase MltG [Methylococcales bacterium]|nr:endolytic transglycosylase MltG [Methylococcales bacterium]
MLKTLLFGLIASLAILIFSLYQHYQASLGQASTAQTVVVEIPDGASLAKISVLLDQALDTFNPVWFQLYARQTDQARQLKSGEYLIPAHATPKDILALLVSGAVRQHKLTIPEGWTFAQFYQAVRRHPAIHLSLPENPEQAELFGLAHPEGWFFPDTYFFRKGTYDLDLLALAHQRMQTVLAEEWQRRGDNLAIDSPYQALILASIIEKETGLAAERDQIAGVFMRRLQRGMRLQTDPTVIYGLGRQFNGNLTREHLRQATPYNTYTIDGLPPTPIALPGRAALHAALHPAPGDSLYFVASGQGGHIFSRTLKEHNLAVQRYQRTLQQP